MKIKILFSLILFSQLSFSQNLSKSFTFGGQTRTYRINIPAAYNDSVPVPLVLAMHGMGDNAANFQGVGFNEIADTANFIAVYPNALVDPVFGASGWSAGVGAFGVYVNGNIDDVGFLNALIDTVSKNYSIDSLRIYATGFSIGGYMAQRLACEMNDRIAAIASVSGLIGAGITCNPQRPVPVMHMHGTADSTISYAGSFPFPGFGQIKVGMSVDEMISFWLNKNNCTAIPDTIPLTKLGYQLEKINFGICDDSTELIFYKIFGLPHDWLASQNDLYATEEIWNFFKRHKRSTEIPDTTVNFIPEISGDLKIYPNPFSDNIFIQSLSPESLVTVYDLLGKKMIHIETESSSQNRLLEISLNHLQKGIYFLSVQGSSQPGIAKIIKNE